MAVADGVTRDCKNGKAADKSLKGITSIVLHYPKPSPAKKASEIFCDAWGFADFESKEPVRKTLEEANSRIKRFNQREISETDYLVNDLAGCTAACAFEKDGKVEYGFICSSGVAIFDSNGGLRFKTKDEGPHGEKSKFLDKIVKENGGWENPRARRIIRTVYRNNPRQENSFGVLTGEPEALEYVRTGTEELQSGEHLVVYTDGIKPLLTDNEFAEFLVKRDYKNLERLCKRKVHSDGSLAINYKE